MNLSKVWRLELDSQEAQQLSDALELVIQQPPNVQKGNHFNLCYNMEQVFGSHFSKYEAVEGAIYALGRDDDILNIESGDIYIHQLKQRKLEEQRLIQIAEEQDF